MEKLVYGLWRRTDQDLDAIRETLLDEVAPALLEAGVDGLRICVEEPAGDLFRVGANPDGGLLAACVSLWLASCDDRVPHERAIARAGTTVHGWIVAESVPRAYGTNRRWPEGERSPGLSITTFFDKRGDVTDEAFYRIWHGEHTPLSVEIHPLWLYVRNQVLRPVTNGAPKVCGIVYEAVPTDEDLLELTRFFGCTDDPRRLGAQLLRVDDHLDTFADRATLQCVTMREWIIKTLST